MPHMDFVVGPQAVVRPGIIELRWGTPDLALLPVEEVGAAAREALRLAGPVGLDYGTNEGPEVLRAAVAARIARDEGCPVALNEIAITNGISPAFHQLASLRVRPGDAVLVEDPVYNLALGLLRDLGIEPVGVPFDAGGLDIGRLPDVLARLRAQRLRPRLLYTVPTYHNPTGLSLAGERRRRLVELAVEEDLLIVEDDAYRELWYDKPAPPSLWRVAADVEGAAGHIVRLGSFSKSLAPGLRCGYLTGSPALVRQYTESGLIESAGCLSQFTALIVAAALQDGSYDRVVRRFRSAYRERRDALIAGLHRSLPGGCTVTEPGGGYFVWVSLPPRLTAGALLPLAEAEGVSFFGGALFSVSGADHGLRLCFAMYGPEELAEGAARLGRAIDRALDER
jgi:2-aminoadipate transaminase